MQAMRAPMELTSLAAAIAFCGGACTTYLYKGPTPPSSQVAVIMSSETIVDTVDDAQVRDSAMGTLARLEVLPGPHRLGISLNRVDLGSVTRSRGYITVCANLEAGHTYETRPMQRGERFFPR